MLLFLVALVTMLLPGILFGTIAMMTQGRITEGPVVRAFVAVREIPKAVELDRSGRLVGRQGYASPASLDLVVTDLSGAVVFSTIPSIVLGSRPSLTSIATIADEYVPRASFYADAVEFGNKREGTWYAILPTDAARSLAGETTPLLRLTGYAYIFGVAFLFGILAAAMLASQMRRLEKAALAIAAGDLETPVLGRGAREIVALATAMEGMRKAIKEDLARRSRFLAAVSHDLRTPLTAIGGYLEAIEDGLAEDPAVLGRYVSIMKDKTGVLEERIGGLIEFARVETGEWRLAIETLPLLELFEGFARDAREQCELAGSSLEVGLEAIGGISAPADRGLLSRAFENLVSNALRHGRKGGLLRLGARRAKDERGRELLLVDVDDEGPGIAPADRERVFEAYWRGSEARQGEGSGLGLYIARSILRDHGWDLKASSAPGGGGRFTIAIPLDGRGEG